MYTETAPNWQIADQIIAMFEDHQYISVSRFFDHSSGTHILVLESPCLTEEVLQTTLANAYDKLFAKDEPKPVMVPRTRKDKIEELAAAYGGVVSSERMYEKMLLFPFRYGQTGLLSNMFRPARSYRQQAEYLVEQGHVEDLQYALELVSA